MITFIDNLIDKIKLKKSHVVVGLDPDFNNLPTYLKNNAYSLVEIGEAIFEFNIKVIDAICDLVPAIKPQIAFYERYGLDGINAFVKTVNYGKKKGLIVIEDAKRNDIGSTATAYSDGHIGRVEIHGKSVPAFDVDAITVNPYLGSDGIVPFLQNIKNYGKGIFVLVKTSNKTSVELQDIKVNDEHGETHKLYEVVAKLVNNWGKTVIGNSGYSSVGAVVGATFPRDAQILRRLMPNTYFLVPGFGTQGGRAEDVVNSFNKDGLGAIINASRSIIYAYQFNEKYNEVSFADAARDAALRMNKEINQELKKRQLLIW